MNQRRRWPDQVRFTLSRSSGLPIEGASVSLLAKTDYKNPFWFLFGPTDCSGGVSIMWSDIEQRAKETAEFALMDYGNFEAAFTGEMHVFFADEDRLSRALRAYEEYKGVCVFPPNYTETLRRGIDAARTVGTSKITCRMECIPTPGDLRVELNLPLVCSD